MSTITLDSTISNRDDILTSDLHNETVMMNIDRGQYYGMEAVGSQIWQTIGQPIKVSAVVDKLLTQFDGVDRPTCEAETIQFLNDLLAEELIVVHSSTSA